MAKQMKRWASEWQRFDLDYVAYTPKGIQAHFHLVLSSSASTFHVLPLLGKSHLLGRATFEMLYYVLSIIHP